MYNPEPFAFRCAPHSPHHVPCLCVRLRLDARPALLVQSDLFQNVNEITAFQTSSIMWIDGSLYPFGQLNYLHLYSEWAGPVQEVGGIQK